MTSVGMRSTLAIALLSRRACDEMQSSLERKVYSSASVFQKVAVICSINSAPKCTATVVLRAAVAEPPAPHIQKRVEVRYSYAEHVSYFRATHHSSVGPSLCLTYSTTSLWQIAARLLPTDGFTAPKNRHTFHHRLAISHTPLVFSSFTSFI